MRSSRLLGAALILLGAGIAAYVVLGPLLLKVIRFRTSVSGLNQITGGDAVALVLVAPASVVIGVLALRGHRAAPVLALAPAIFAMYTYSQLILGNEYLRLPGNVERFFPLLLGIFLTAAAVTVLAWTAAASEGTPAQSRGLERAAGALLLVMAAFVVFGLHLPSYVDALRDSPARSAYLEAPTAFWMVKFWDLGLVAPSALVVGTGLLRGAAWARVPMYLILGGYVLLGCSVAGMVITMSLRGDPDASAGLIVVSTLLAVAGLVFLALLYRPLFTAEPPATVGLPAAQPGAPVPEAGTFVRS